MSVMDGEPEGVLGKGDRKQAGFHGDIGCVTAGVLDPRISLCGSSR